MNDRKQHVIKMAHQLFIDKGFQATSIQDILDYSGISKGTFYNYFSSKNELLVALFKTLYKQMEKERNELLIGQDPANIDIFTQQVELQMKMNRKNKLISLFEEVYFSNDEDLKEFIKRGQLRILHWIYGRFIDIFGEGKKPYLLDGAIIFMGILNHNIKYYTMVHGTNANLQQAVRYSVARIVKMVEEAAEAGDQLFQPELLDSWLPDCRNADEALQQKLSHAILALKKAASHKEDYPKYIELLDFVQDELLHSKKPRQFLIESALLSLQAEFDDKAALQKLNQLVADYFTQIEDAD
ncbi:MAG: TetR/AcrR family transcriptional regulator [Ectobacillus sp.]